MKKTFAALLIGLCVPFIAGYLFIYFGGMPVATNSAPLPLESELADLALHQARRAASSLTSPVPPSPENLLAGARIYRESCAVCHGLPGKQEASIPRGMFPDPPQFFAEKREEHEEHEEHEHHDHGGGTYWVVKNGIRLTGMPAFEQSLSETELWQVVQFLRHSKPMTPDLQRELAR